MKLWHLRSYLKAFEPPRPMGRFQNLPVSAQPLRRLPHWTARAGDEFRRVLGAEVDLQEFVCTLKEA